MEKREDLDSVEGREMAALELRDRYGIPAAVCLLAARAGVPLAVAQEALRLRAANAPVLPVAPAAASPGPFSIPMPQASALLSDLKAWLGDEWPAALEALREGRGYAVDHTTNIALGNPPMARFARGRIEQRHGFKIMRVQAKADA
jgi:hypothetical protein